MVVASQFHCRQQQLSCRRPLPHRLSCTFYPRFQEPSVIVDTILTLQVLDQRSLLRLGVPARTAIVQVIQDPIPTTGEVMNLHRHRDPPAIPADSDEMRICDLVYEPSLFETGSLPPLPSERVLLALMAGGGRAGDEGAVSGYCESEGQHPVMLVK
jgi:hypothetical protein